MTIANWLTVGRILLIPVFIYCLSNFDPGKDVWLLAAFWVFIAASVTDLFDGLIARRLNQHSDLGTFLDPLADKALLVTAFLMVFFLPHLALKPPFWVILIIVFRDLVIISGLFVIFFSTGKVTVEPNLLGKVTTFSQMATLAAILLQLSISPFLWSATALLTVCSGVVYTVREVGRINGKAR